MSAKSKAASREKRRQQKRARKEAMRMQYQAWASSGTNKKKKTQADKSRRLVKDVSHRLGPCGNIGCTSCSPLAAAYKANKNALKRHPKKKKGWVTRGLPLQTSEAA